MDNSICAKAFVTATAHATQSKIERVDDTAKWKLKRRRPAAGLVNEHEAMRRI